jgi:preprotein translocase subunit SecG
MVGFYIFGVLALIVAIMMILAVVIQNSKGGGLSSTFGGASGATQMFGARRSNEFIEKLTWYLAIGLAVVSFLANIMASGSGPTDDSLMIQKSLDGQVNMAPMQAPMFDDQAVPGGEAGPGLVPEEE